MSSPSWDVEHLGGDAQHGGGLLHFGVASFGEGPAGHSPVSDITVGGRDEFHEVASLVPEDGGSSAADFAIVGVGSEDEDPNILGILSGCRGIEECPNCGQEEDKLEGDAGFVHGSCLLDGDHGNSSRNFRRRS